LYTGLALGGLGGFIAEYWGWRAGFHVFGAFGVLYSLVLVYCLKDVKKATEESDGSVAVEERSYSIREVLSSLFKLPSFYVILVFFAVLGMANWLVNGLLTTFLKDQFQLDLGTAVKTGTGYNNIRYFIGGILVSVIAVQ